MARNRRVVAGLDSGYCRVCGVKEVFSDDHVLPEKCGNSGVVRIQYGNKSIYSQNGMCFKTICAKCNSNLLGIQNDPELIRIFKEARAYLSNTLLGSFRYLQLKTNSDLFLKSLLGHFLATSIPDGNIDNLQMKLDYSAYYEDIRQFVLGLKPMGKRIECYYWLYTGSETVINHYFALMPDTELLPGGVMYGSVIKSFPFGFWIVDSETSTLVPKKLRLMTAEREHLITFDRFNTLHNKFSRNTRNSGSKFVQQQGDGQVATIAE